VTARIVQIQSAFPPTAVKQDEVYDIMSAHVYRGSAKAASVFASTQVRQRHLAWHPRDIFAGPPPPMSLRMSAWRENVLALGGQTGRVVLDGVDTSQVGSFVVASCTGYVGPGPDSVLAGELGLPAGVRRTFVGHMGCSAAFNAVKIALDALTARPSELVLLTCAEICSVHTRAEPSAEQVVVHALFGDAACSALLSADPHASGPAVIGTHTETHYGFADAMTWVVMDDSFRMTLSPYIPLIISEAVGPFVERLLAPHGLKPGQIRHWGIHPGGPKIIDLVGGQFDLADSQLMPSRDILAEHGNCSSPTILLILERILTGAAPAPGDYGIFMAFGPGLTMESMLVRF
jgi:predicted naringenin-chalcone synthase